LRINFVRFEVNVFRFDKSGLYEIIKIGCVTQSEVNYHAELGKGSSHVTLGELR